MDDTTWLNHSQTQLESTLEIADEFYVLNNIQVNKGKSILLTNNSQVHKHSPPSEICLRFGSSAVNITPLDKYASTRILGVWINLNCSQKFVAHQIKSDVIKFNKIVRSKQLTDKHLSYIYNHVIMPTISYKSQLTVFSEKQCISVIKPFTIMFKKKLGHAKTLPDFFIFSTLGYNLKSFYQLQLENQTSYLKMMFASPNLLFNISRIRCLQLQYDEWLASSPLEHWSYTFQPRFTKSLVAAVLSLMYTNNLSLKLDLTPFPKIKGGTKLIPALLPNYINSRIHSNFRRHHILFLSQLTSHDGTRLLNWTDRNISTITHRRGVPVFFKELEKAVLIDPTYSRKLDVIYYTQKRLPLACISPDVWKRKQKEWVSIYDIHAEEVIIGRVVFKCQAACQVYIEHWLHYPANSHISPDSSHIVAYRCPGCQVHRPQFNPVKLFTRNIYYKCITGHPCFRAAVFPKVKKLNNNEYLLASSLFELKQQALDLYRNRQSVFDMYFNIPLPNEAQSALTPSKSLSIDTSVTNSHTLRTLFQPASVNKQLLQFRDLFKTRHSLEFYTDGSLQHVNELLTNMGSAWVEISDIERHIFQIQCSDFASSTRAEAFAILTALYTAPSQCHVTINTDSQTCLHNLTKILDNNYTYNTANQLIWAAITFLIHTSQLILTLNKVQAHSGNPLNDLTKWLKMQ